MQPPWWFESERRVEQRLQVARDQATAADGKAGQVLGAAGVLMAGGGVLAAVADLPGMAAALACLAGGSLAVAVLALLAAIRPRGGDPLVWLVPATLEAAPELVRVAHIVACKHLWLRCAIWCMAAAVLLGITAAVVAGMQR